MNKIYIITVIISLLASPVIAKNDKHKKHSDLPPGLAKKAENGGSLPPGWQKKLVVGETLEKDIYQHRKVLIPVDKKGLVTIEIDGKIVRLFDATREVVEILN